ncbi:MAG: hypothetical protein RLZZ11_326 [Cyanobacteriota bacterium]
MLAHRCRPDPDGDLSVLQQDWQQPCLICVRSSASRLGLLLLPLALWLAPVAASAAPASEVDMSLYTRIGALNVCISRAAGIEFDKAVAVAGETIAQVIQGQHEGAIAQVGPKPLTIDEPVRSRYAPMKCPPTCARRWRTS